MIQTHFLSRFLLSGLATCLTSIAYSTYQETKADQYAFRRMNKEDIEKVQVYMENEAKKDENLILEKMKLHKIRGFFINVIYDISLRFSGNMSEKQKKECITK
jgi:hypothetical protein